jgi:hypothetical protein
MKTDYTSWGTNELIEKCQNAEVFAKEVAEFLQRLDIGRTDYEFYLLEKARKLGGLK